MNFSSSGRKPKILIAGGGPAGASLACRLARGGFETILIEREKFPREKLCGEFVSPECLEHFRELGVLDEMIAIGGDRIEEIVFYAPGGKNVAVKSAWFGADHSAALGISRAAMDFRLLEKARSDGALVLEETSVNGVICESGKIRAVKIKTKTGETSEIAADLFIDATGRAAVLEKLVKKARIQDSKFQIPNSENRNQKSKIKNQKSSLVGFKTHLENVHLEKGLCEIYFFRGGYGGLSYVENGRANHCFLIEAETVKKYVGQTNLLLEEVIFENCRARETMEKARPVYDWLTVAVDRFGRKNLNPAENLFALGDAAAFIDPFTGSGMLMALESSEMLARAIFDNPADARRLAAAYDRAHRAVFDRRLRVCRLMRRAAFVPYLAGITISALSLSRPAREFLARATRRSEDTAGLKSQNP